ncbi:oocyte zinc finger protein XlCOF7.1-like isoform X2 [Pelobates fuscus]|uniref:oocyte zinc finger protein XlCOF7.1-like isoform X2 n=1 Tax=Pelobates fuscus TaxID=191477 RepID=UPI002FE475A3
MNKDRNKMTERILNLTLEIIYLLTGEEYVIVKRPGERVRHSSSPCVSGGPYKVQSSSTLPSLHSLTHERNNDKKILELTNKIIQLLTGEDWEYLEEPKDCYKDIMKEKNQPIRTRDGHFGRNTHKGFYTTFSSSGSGNKDKNPIKCNAQTKHASQIEIKLALCKEGHVKDTDVHTPTELKQTEYTSARIKNELASNEKGNLTSTDTYIPTEHKQAEYTSTYYKNKTNLCEEENITDPNMHSPAEYITTYIKEEPASCEEDNLTPTDYTYVNIKEESTSGEDENITDTEIYAPAEHTETDYSSTQIKEEGHPTDTYFYITSHHKRAEYMLNEECRNDSSDMLRVCNSLSIEQHKESIKNYNILSASTFGKRNNTTDGIYSCPERPESHATDSDPVKLAKGHRKKLLACPECGKCYTRRSILVVHQRSHTGEKPFSCFECGKCFTDKSNLLTHQKIHTGENPFSCLECGRCFPYRSYLVKHQKIHTTDKPFSCPVCGKRFAESVGLTTHQRTHTVDKPFSCNQCGKTFVSKSNLAAHQKLHTGERQLKCSECGECFTTKSNLLSHLRSHTSERPFSCPECGKCFSHRSYVNKHQKIHEKGKHL